MKIETIVVKIGGVAASDSSQMELLAQEFAALSASGVLVHGGGAEVSDLSRKLGLEPVFADGIRMTTAPEMDVVEMVLAGTANKRLVRHLQRAGIRAVGISGADAGLVVGRPITHRDGVPSRTATVERINPAIIKDLWSAGYMPVVAPTSSDDQEAAVNINADDVAFALAETLGVDALVFLSDVPGVRIGDAIQPVLTPADVKAGIENGSISGGMIPKVQNAVTAVAHGVRQVVIGTYRHAGDLSALLAGTNGTRISAYTPYEHSGQMRKETRDE